MQNQQKTDSIISYLAAVAPALLQLIAVVSIGLTDTLNLGQLVFRPSFINFANFLVIILSLSIISLSTFWDYNKFSFIKPGENIFLQVKNFWSVLKVFCTLAFISITIFIGVVIFKSQITANIEFWTFAQWLVYIVFMVSTSFIIYTLVLLKIQEKRGKDLYDNFIPRLIDSLRRYGQVKKPEISIEAIDRNNLSAIVKLGGASKYLVRTDFTGEMVSIETAKSPPTST